MHSFYISVLSHLQTLQFSYSLTLNSPTRNSSCSYYIILKSLPQHTIGLWKHSHLKLQENPHFVLFITESPNTISIHNSPPSTWLKFKQGQWRGCANTEIHRKKERKNSIHSNTQINADTSDEKIFQHINPVINFIQFPTAWHNALRFHKTSKHI